MESKYFKINKTLGIELISLAPHSMVNGFIHSVVLIGGLVFLPDTPDELELKNESRDRAYFMLLTDLTANGGPTGGLLLNVDLESDREVVDYHINENKSFFDDLITSFVLTMEVKFKNISY